LLLCAEDIPEFGLGDPEAACALFQVTVALLKEASAKFRPEPWKQALVRVRDQ
jgi:hypothetical protein